MVSECHIPSKSLVVLSFYGDPSWSRCDIFGDVTAPAAPWRIKTGASNSCSISETFAVASSSSLSVARRALQS